MKRDSNEEGPKELRFKNNREFFLFLYQRIRQKGRWWLMPLLFLLIALSYLLNLPGKESLLPALYFIF